jgi:hypothetical protein
LAKKLVGIVVVVAVAGILIGFYVTDFLMAQPKAFHPTAVGKNVNLTIQTVAAIGPNLSSHPSWVSYVVRDQQGTWKRTTNWTVPANSTVHVTVYQFDGDSGLRNPFMGKVRGTIGSSMQVNGKTMNVLDPDLASHTFAIPQLGVLVPLKGVADNAKNQCGFAPCAMSNAHNVIRFSFKVPGKGHYRWQCFVPCAAGWIYGFGGPMQTIGYMDGFINAV